MFDSESSASTYELLLVGSRTTADHPDLPTWAIEFPPTIPPAEKLDPPATDSTLSVVPQFAAAAGLSAADNEFFWASISDADRRYLTARRFAEPCPWCGGRHKHHPVCDDLRLSWEPRLTFGRHNGKPLSQVPRGYLEWLCSATGIADHLREAAADQLNSRKRQA